MDNKKFILFLMLNLFWIILSTSPLLQNIISPRLIVIPCIFTLILYHFTLYNKKGFLSQREIDSVYFLGFLITLMLLAASAYTFTNITQSNDLLRKTIGSQFALGLIATGYGLFGRVTLLNKQEPTDKLNSEIDEQINLIEKLGNRLDELSNKYDNFIEKNLSSLRDNNEKYTNSFFEDITGTIKPYISELKETILSINKTVKGLKIEGLEVATHTLIEFDSVINNTSSHLKTYEDTLKRSINSNEVTAKTYINLNESIAKVNNEFDTLTNNIIQFKNTVNTIDLSSSGLNKNNLDTLYLDIKTSSDEVVSKINDYKVKYQSTLEEQSNKISEEIHILNTATNLLSNSLTSLARKIENALSKV